MFKLADAGMNTYRLTIMTSLRGIPQISVIYVTFLDTGIICQHFAADSVEE